MLLIYIFVIIIIEMRDSELGDLLHVLGVFWSN